MTAWLILKRLYAPHDNTGMIYMRGLPPQEEADTKDKEPMTRSFKDSFARIGGAIAQEYKNHGRLRGISTEILNNAFDAGEKLGDAVRKYAPQAADTAKTQGEKAANVAKTQGGKAVKAAKEYGDQAISKVRQYGGDMAEQAKNALSKAGDRIDDEVSSDKPEAPTGDTTQDREEASADDPNASADADADEGGEPDEQPAEGESSDDGNADDSLSYGINPDDAEKTISGIDEQLKAKRDELESVCAQITYEQGRNHPDEQTLVDLENRRSTIQSNIDYMEESKRVFQASTSSESDK